MIDELHEVIKGYLEANGLERCNRFYSVYAGTVADNNDPKGKYRLKLRVPSVFGNEVHDYWAPPRGIISGSAGGFFAIPAIGDKVWVSFEKGDPLYPIWEYGPDHAVPAGAKPGLDVFQSKSGHRIEFDHTSKACKIEGNGAHIKLEADGCIYLGNNRKDLQAWLADLTSALSSLSVITPQGPGTVDPVTLAALQKLSVELALFLKS